MINILQVMYSQHLKKLYLSSLLNQIVTLTIFIGFTILLFFG